MESLNEIRFYPYVGRHYYSVIHFLALLRICSFIVAIALSWRPIRFTTALFSNVTALHPPCLQNLIAVIGIINALFIIIFTAHILGCAFTMLADSEPGDNWMIHYEPALVGATNDVRYIAAIYWAMIRWPR